MNIDLKSGRARIAQTCQSESGQAAIPVVGFLLWGALIGIIAAFITLSLGAGWLFALLAYALAGAAGCLAVAGLYVLRGSRRAKQHRPPER